MERKFMINDEMVYFADELWDYREYLKFLAEHPFQDDFLDANKKAVGYVTSNAKSKGYEKIEIMKKVINDRGSITVLVTATEIESNAANQFISDGYEYPYTHIHIQGTISRIQFSGWDKEYQLLMDPISEIIGTRRKIKYLEKENSDLHEELIALKEVSLEDV